MAKLKNYFVKICISTAFIFSLFGCASKSSSIIRVSSVEDIPDISKMYKPQIAQLKVGMNQYQINSLFPNLERECYESGVCHFTVFDERQVQIDPRIDGLSTLSGTLVSMFALTCLLAEETCPKALAAAINVGLATAVESANIQGSPNPTTGLIPLINLINHGTLGIQVDGEGRRVADHGYRSSPPSNGVYTLIQWINIELHDGKVKEWAVNEPLQQFRPKTYKNELPDLEEALGL